MINSLVLLVLIGISLSAAVGRTFDVRASRVGRLSSITVALLAMLISATFAFAVVMIFNAKKILPELKSASQAPEFKYLIMSALFYVPTFLTIYWVFAKEKAHISAIFFSSLMITFNVLCSIVILKEKVLPTTWLGIVIVLSGLFLIGTNNNHVTKN